MILSDYDSVATALLVEMQYLIPTYSRTVPYTVRFSDYNSTITVDGNAYLGLSRFLSIGTTQNSVQSSTGEVDIAITALSDYRDGQGNVYTGHSNQLFSKLMTNKSTLRFQNQLVTIKRIFFDPSTHQLLPLATNPIGRFYGVIKSWSISETQDQYTKSGEHTVLFRCSDLKGLLETKYSAVKTENNSRQAALRAAGYSPTESAFARTRILKSQKFKWGQA